MQPVTGSVYVSEAQPHLRLFIDAVSEPEADGFYLVTAVELDDDEDAAEAANAPGIELTGDEWAAMAAELRLKAES